MRVLLVAVAIVAGCAPQGSNVTGGGYDDAGCKFTCDRCPPQTVCVGIPYVPACLVQCRATSDCDTGICVVVGEGVGPSGGLLAFCSGHPVDCSNITPQCRDAMTQLKPLPKTSAVCGWEVIHCDSGCDSATGSCT